MNNPLIDRYAGLSDRKYIIEKTTVRPSPVIGLETCNVNTAALRLKHQLEQIFIPNEFATNFMAEMIESSAWFCSLKYPDEISYNRSIFHPSNEEMIPVCLTGLAGVGKTALLKALIKVLPDPVKYSSKILGTNVDLISYWMATGRDKGTPKQLLSDMVESTNSGSVNRTLTAHHLLVMARSFAGKHGLALIVMDEMQHVTLSNATALITSQILTLSKLGVPILYVSNYSLQNSLFDRNAEDKQRLTANPRILEPDEPEGDDWKVYVDECVRVVGVYIAVSAKNLSSELHKMTFGLKRFVVRILTIAYAEARRKGRNSIELSDVDTAYASAEYTSARAEVLVLKKQLIEQRCVRRDLWCPYLSPNKPPSVAGEFYAKDNAEQLAKAAIRSSMTPSEKTVLRDLTGSERTLELKPAKGRSSSKKATYDDLLDGHRRFVDPGTK